MQNLHAAVNFKTKKMGGQNKTPFFFFLKQTNKNPTTNIKNAKLACNPNNLKNDKPKTKTTTYY